MNFHRNHWLLFSIVFFGFIFLAIIIAIAPAYWTQAQVEVNYTGETFSDHEREGLAVYISEGCVSCHTQQVRPLDRSEEHTSELQTRGHLVCRPLLEKTKSEEHTTELQT